MDKNKEVGLDDLLNDNKKKLSNYKPKKEKPNKRGSKHRRKSKKNITHDANDSSQKKHITYSNIRTNTDIVDTLNCYQAANGYKSRSDLLSVMIKMCKPMLLNTKAKKNKFNMQKKAIELERKLHNK